MGRHTTPIANPPTLTGGSPQNRSRSICEGGGLHFQDYQKVLYELLQDIERGDCCFLVGAGVSMLPPTQLPSGPELRDMAVQAVLFRESENSPIWENLLFKNTRYKEMIPELAFESIFAALGEKLFPFFELLRFTRPNHAHAILGHLCAERRIPIMTTNFENLIEQRTPGRGTVVHLHGELSDIPEMMTRISQVGRGLPQRTRDTAVSLLKQRKLYVFGYSGNDRDVISMICSARPKKVIWCARSLPLRQSSNIERIGNVHIFQADLNQVFLDVQRRILPRLRTDGAPTNSLEIRNQRAAHIRDWSATVNSTERRVFTVKILYDVGEYAGSAKLCRDAVRAKDTTTQFSVPYFLNEAGEAMRHAGRFAAVRRYCLQAIRRQSRPPDRSRLASSLNLMGLMYLEQRVPQLQPALRYFIKTRKLLYRLLRSDSTSIEKHQIFLAMVENNLGMVYDERGDSFRAAKHHRNSLRLAKRWGDILAECYSQINLSLAYLKGGKRGRSAFWRKQALGNIERYGFAFQKAYLDRQTGELLCKQGLHRTGLPLLKQALDTYHKLGIPFGVNLTKKILRDCTPA